MNEFYKNNKLKLTKQRKIILNTIENLSDNATLKNILKNCEDKINKSTIYRILDIFTEKNIIEKNINYKKEIYYSIKEEHSHYFTCIKCHKKEKLVCPMKEINYEIIEKKGYKILNHSINIDGICLKCQNGDKSIEKVV